MASAMRLSNFVFIINLCMVNAELQVCKAQSIIIEVILDGTNNIGLKEKKIASHVIENMIKSNLPDTSSVHVTAIADSLVEIVGVDIPYDNLEWMTKLHGFDVSPIGNSVNLALVDKELKSLFTVNKYRQKAELALVFVSSSTKLEGMTQMLQKKKAIIVVFGDHIPNIYRALAMDGNHTHLIEKDHSFLPNLTNTILNQVYCASNHPCDRNLFRRNPGTKCMNCSILCGEDMNNGRGSCTRCPYIYQPLLPERNIDRNTNDTTIWDKTWFVVLLILILLGVAAIPVVLLICWCKRKAKKKDNYPEQEQNKANEDPGAQRHNERHSDEEQPGIPESPDGETGNPTSDTPDENRSLLTWENEVPPSNNEERFHLNEVHVGLLDGQQDLPQANLGLRNDGNCFSRVLYDAHNVIDETGETRATSDEPFVIEFKNPQELDANGHTFGEQIIQLHRQGQMEERI